MLDFDKLTAREMGIIPMVSFVYNNKLNVLPIINN